MCNNTVLIIKFCGTLSCRTLTKSELPCQHLVYLDKEVGHHFGFCLAKMPAPGNCPVYSRCDCFLKWRQRRLLVVLVSLMQEGVISIHLCVHPVDVAGEIIYEDHEKYVTRMLFRRLFLQRLYLSLRAVRSAAILLFVLRRFVLDASSACFFPFFLPPPNPQSTVSDRT